MCEGCVQNCTGQYKDAITRILVLAVFLGILWFNAVIDQIYNRNHYPKNKGNPLITIN